MQKQIVWYMVAMAFIQHPLQSATTADTAFLYIAHRGASENENTLSAFKHAIQSGAKAIEFDVHRCASGEPVVIHDSFLYHTTKSREIGWIGDYTLEQIKKLRLRGGKEIPTLAAVLDTVVTEERELKRRRVLINVELKGKGSAIPAAKVIAEYMKKYNWPSEKFLVSSFLPEELETFKKESPETPLGLLIDWHPAYYLGCCASRAIPWALCNKLDIKVIGIPDALASRNIVDQVRKKNELMNLLVYTVNCPRRISWLKEIGVDGVFTDNLEFAATGIPKEQ